MRFVTKIEELERKVAQVGSEATELAAALADQRRVNDDLTAQVNNLQRRNDEIFVRHHVAAMDRQHLISLATECINEARRKGLIEAEGLIQRHRELEEQTDVEMMQGVVDVYTKRIAEVKAKAQPPVKLDNRKLTERVPELPSKPARPAPLTPNEARSWWSPDPVVTPIKTLAVGAHATVPGTKGGTYIIKRSSDKVYTCTCPAWQFSALPAEERTCKHLTAYLGLAAETKRIEAAIQASKVQKSCWCGVILVNGQCQVHTQNWKGEERCNCGRLFSFCKEEYTTGRAVTRAWHTPRLAGTPEPVKH